MAEDTNKIMIGLRKPIYQYLEKRSGLAKIRLNVFISEIIEVWMVEDVEKRKLTQSIREGK